MYTDLSSPLFSIENNIENVLEYIVSVHVNIEKREEDISRPSAQAESKQMRNIYM